jgi:Ca2+-binding RTX toxin-like protein
MPTYSELLGTVAAETIVGSAGSDSIDGLDGSDYLISLAGDDRLFGRSSSPNTLQGGSGNDTYYVDRKDNSIIENIESSLNVDLLRLTTHSQPISMFRPSISQIIVRVQLPNTHDAEYAEFRFDLNASGQWSIGALSVFDNHRGTGTIISSSDSVWEYAFQYGSTQAGPFDFAGLDHGDEQALSFDLILDGTAMGTIPVGSVVNATTLTLSQNFSLRSHVDSRIEIGTISLQHQFDSNGLTVDHSRTYSQPAWIDTSYSAMLPFTFGDAVRIGDNSYAINHDGSYRNFGAYASSAVVSSLSSAYLLSLSLPSGGPDTSGSWSYSAGPDHFWFHDAAENGKLYVDWVSGAPIEAVASHHVAHYSLSTSAPASGTPLIRAEAEGVDTLVSSVPITLPTHVEILRLSGNVNQGFGNDENNILIGSEADNTLFGRYGDDELRGEGGDDTIYGGPGNDLMFGGTGRDTVNYADAKSGFTLNLATGLVTSATEGNDLAFGFENVVGSAFNDVLIGDRTDNLLMGGNGRDSILGAEGDDVLVGGDGDPNELYGGPGNDRYLVSTFDLVFELNGEGVDSVFASLPSYQLPAFVEILKFLGNSSNQGTGNDLDNILIGGSGDDILHGLSGQDYLIGGAGNDTLDGGSVDSENLGNTLQGGLGDDIYLVIARQDSTLEFAGEGIDEVRTDFSTYNLQVNIENLTATGNGAHAAMVGNELDNAIRGGGGQDDLFGRDGNDSLYGGSGAANTLLGQLGDDQYFIETAGDSIIERPNEGTDTVFTALGSFVLRDNVENLTYTGVSRFVGIGSSDSNMITGGALADDLSGLSGNDILIGGSGADILQGGTGSDQFRYIGGETGLDRILDFQPDTDKIALMGTAFIHTARVDFISNAAPAPTTTNSTFLYNVNNGIIFFDADGTGAAAAVQLAQLNVGQVLSAGDFIFV